MDKRKITPGYFTALRIIVALYHETTIPLYHYITGTIECRERGSERCAPISGIKPSREDFDSQAGQTSLLLFLLFQLTAYITFVISRHDELSR